MWPRRRKSRQLTRLEAERDDLARECELFLAGRYLERLLAMRRPVPAWAWFNRLAHGSLEDLAALRAEAADRSLPSEWTQAVAFLAGEIQQRADNDPDRLHALQRDVLIPMELRLAADWFVPLKPSHFVRLVSEGLTGRQRRPPPGDA